MKMATVLILLACGSFLLGGCPRVGVPLPSHVPPPPEGQEPDNRLLFCGEVKDFNTGTNMGVVCFCIHPRAGKPVTDWPTHFVPPPEEVKLQWKRDHADVKDL